MARCRLFDLLHDFTYWPVLMEFLDFLDMQSLLMVNKATNSMLSEGEFNIHRHAAERLYPKDLLKVSMYQGSWRNLLCTDNYLNMGYVRPFVGENAKEMLIFVRHRQTTGEEINELLDGRCVGIGWDHLKSTVGMYIMIPQETFPPDDDFYGVVDIQSPCSGPESPPVLAMIEKIISDYDRAQQSWWPVKVTVKEADFVRWAFLWCLLDTTNRPIDEFVEQTLPTPRFPIATSFSYQARQQSDKLIHMLERPCEEFSVRKTYVDFALNPGLEKV